ncbi:MAG: hypothetical protein R2715_13640 [Ilumatobacteraceae bacterium]
MSDEQDIADALDADEVGENPLPGEVLEDGTLPGARDYPADDWTKATRDQLDEPLPDPDSSDDGPVGGAAEEGIDVIDPNLDPDVLDDESELLAERSDDETDAAEVAAMHVIPDDRSN